MHWAAPKSRSSLVAVLITIVIAVIFISCEDDISGPNGIQPYELERNYFPMDSGAVYVYKSLPDPGIDTTSNIYTVQSVQVVSEGRIAIIQILGTGPTQSTLTANWSHDRLFFSTDLAGEGADPLLALDIPVSPGKTWTKINASSADFVDLIKSTVVAVDTPMTVLSGTFDALLIKDVHYIQEGENEPEQVDSTYFAYALGVGIISMGHDSSLMELASFTPGVSNDTTSSQ